MGFGGVAPEASEFIKISRKINGNLQFFDIFYGNFVIFSKRFSNFIECLAKIWKKFMNF